MGDATGLTGDAGGVVHGLRGKITKDEQRRNGALAFRREIGLRSGTSASNMLLLLQ